MPLPYRKVLLTLDGSELARQALPQAEYLSRSFDASLVVLQVVPDLEAQALRYASEPLLLDFKAYMSGQQEELTSQIKLEMEQIALDLKQRGINAVAAVEIGDPAPAIIDYAAANDVDVIVMSTHGRTGLERWVYGSVANKVLQSAHCPVLLVRASRD